MNRGLWVLGCLGWAWSLGADVSADTDVRSLLIDGWSTKGTAAAHTDAVFAAAAAQGLSLELRYAYQLALTRQRRYRDALAASDRLLQEHPRHGPTRQLRVWLHLIRARPGDALGDLEGIASLWPPLEGNNAVRTEELAGWCGAAFGVLEGPLASKMGPARIDRTLAKFLDALGPAPLRHFELRRAEVLRAYHDRLQEWSQVQHQEVAEDLQRRRDEQDRLDGRLQAIATELRKLREQSREVHDHYADGRRDVAGDAPQLVGALAESTTRQSFFGRQLLGMELEIWRLDECIARERDPVRRAALIDQRAAWIWQSQLDGYQWDQAGVDRLVALQGLDQVQNELLSLHQAESLEQMELARRRTRLTREQSRSEQRQERLREADLRPSGRVRSLKKKLDAVSTYLEYPLEEERARLLR